MMYCHDALTYPLITHTHTHTHTPCSPLPHTEHSVYSITNNGHGIE